MAPVDQGSKAGPNGTQPLRIAVFADGAKKEDMLKLYKQGVVKGFTTNPSLMAKAGVTDYLAFAQELLREIPDMPISFEVFADDFATMEKQAGLIRGWGKNVYVKIPIINTKGESSIPLIRRLLEQGTKLNITAIFTDEQLAVLREALRPQDDVIVSVFAGRLADTGFDPIPIMQKAVRDYQGLPNAKILWASTREVFNVYQADQIGVHIITAPSDVIGKLAQRGKTPLESSIETVKSFLQDSTKSGFSLKV